MSASTVTQMIALFTLVAFLIAAAWTLTLARLSR
jgi:hypothetical protein